MFFDIFLFVVGLLLLLWGGDRLVRSASKTAHLLGVSTLLISLTVVSFSTSAPELFVSITAPLNGEPDIALGNIIGSNIANIGLILGLAILIFPLKADGEALRKEYPIVALLSIFLLILARDGLISRGDGIVLLLLFVAYMVYYIQTSRRSILDKIHHTLPPDRLNLERRMTSGILMIILAVGALILGSKLVVDGAVVFAQSIGVSEMVIALSLVAFGTSLPELTTIITASIRKEPNISVGTILGSNVFNILRNLSVAAVIMPIRVPVASIRVDMVVMILMVLALYPILHRNIRTFRLYGIILLIGYIGYLYIKFTS
ncbi:MAG: calcium/sodium antiporter [Parcubacteria group bacterium]